MKIYCAHSTSFDFRNDYYLPLSRLGRRYELIFPHLQSSSVRNSKSIIQSCDLVVAEASYPSTGMGIELGWADVFEKPIIAVHKQASSPSSSISIVSNRIYAYVDHDDLINILMNCLQDIENKKSTTDQK